MDNVLKKTIREEIVQYNKEKGKGSKSEYILHVNTSPTNPQEKIKFKAPQTERSLSNLLEINQSFNRYMAIYYHYY